MYGFGDSITPLPETVQVMDEILEWFIVDLCTSASRLSPNQGLKTSDVMRVLMRNGDTKKVARAGELLVLDRELKAARAAFDVKDMQ